MKQRLAQKRKSLASSTSYKKVRLFKLEPKPAKAPIRYDHPRTVGTFSGSTADATPKPIIQPTSTASLSPSSALAAGTSEASTNREIEKASKQANPRVWETCQEVFKKSLFVKNMEELRVMNSTT